MPEPTPMKQPQHELGERKVEDSNVEEAILTLERFEATKKLRRGPVRDASTRANERIEADRERLGVEAAEEVYAAFVAKLEQENEPGAIIRVGPYRLEVEQYTTMERVEKGVGKRVKKFKRVEGEAPEAKLPLS